MAGDFADVNEITALIHRYAALLDAGRLDELAELFAHAELRSTRHDRVRHGAAGAREMLEPVVLYDDGTPRTMHQLTNVTVDVEGDTATASSYFTVLQVTHLGLHPVLGGEYRDRFERADGAWRFAVREYRPILFGDLSEHMRREPS